MSSGIGGYLELEYFYGEHYHKGVILLNCGRGCLAYLIELRGIKRVWLPDFMCESVYMLFIRENVKVCTYKVDKDFHPIYDYSMEAYDWMILVDYYGQLQRNDVDIALDYCSGNLIVDEIQGFFCKPWEGVDTIYSCRKWFGVADGGYLATSDGTKLSRNLDYAESHTCMKHILGRFERPPSEFYTDACINNEFFENEPAKKMSLITENLLRAVDYEEVRRRRNCNWARLDSKLGNSNLLALKTPNAPFMYPYLVRDAEGMRQKLTKQGVFIPTLWPNVLTDCNVGAVAYNYARNILPLPCDQRYVEADMEYILLSLEKK